ncbi:MAG: nuclear transport factor 2 family protein [Hyphomonadaceae bacterium]|nr:nuclear transport factor 2 family protein [Hyphomonadaceae bacterium]
MSAADIVQAQVDAYNAQDLDALLSFYTDDCILADLNGPVRQAGKDAVRARYAELFKTHPHNRATILNRIVVGDTVIDHEDVVRAPGGERFQVAAIYTLRGGLIARCDFAR